MKELFNILSTISDFLNEKRFVYQREKPPAKVTPKTPEELAREVGKAYCGNAYNIACDSRKQGDELYQSCKDAVKELGREKARGSEHDKCEMPAVEGKKKGEKKGGEAERRKAAEAERQGAKKPEKPREMSENERLAEEGIKRYEDNPESEASKKMFRVGSFNMLNDMNAKYTKYFDNVIKILEEYHKSRGEVYSATITTPKLAHKYFKEFLEKKENDFYVKSAVRYYNYNMNDLDAKRDAVVDEAIAKVCPKGFEALITHKDTKKNLELARVYRARRKRPSQ